MTIVLLIAVLALVGALVYVLLARREPAEEVDLAAAVQQAAAEAATEATSHVLRSA